MAKTDEVLPGMPEPPQEQRISIIGQNGRYPVHVEHGEEVTVVIKGRVIESGVGVTSDDEEFDFAKIRAESVRVN